MLLPVYIMVIAHKFTGIWRMNKIPEFAVILAHTSDANKAPNVIGKENARKTSATQKKELQGSSIYWLEPKDLTGDYFKGEGKSIEFEVHEILNILKNIGADRLQMRTGNFIEHIELLKQFFENPIDAVHAFYAMVPYWDITSTVSTNEYSDKIRLTGFKGHRHSEEIGIKPFQIRDFTKFVEGRYIFTNEGSGLTVDYYFSRFDEVMARIDPEYVKQHGIFFTDINLSKFALWFAKKALGDQLNERYIFFDPAGGSGNLISSWRGKLKHKIISELQPDLLRIIERRMRIDPWHVEAGFTIIPKTSENIGLNFLDCDAAEYMSHLDTELRGKNIIIDKPIAFLLNPPYKNTDENDEARETAKSNYQIHTSIIDICGEDAGKERYLAFLGQIYNISNFQNQQNPLFDPIVLVFTPTSWLIPRTTYIPFRERWDKVFEYIDGFIITSNEFFKLKGKWPLSFTVWKYKKDEIRQNKIVVSDFTHLKKSDLQVNWNLGDDEIKFVLGSDIFKPNKILISNNRISIKDWVGQSRFDFTRSPSKKEQKGRLIYGGLPLRDHRRVNKKTYGIENGEFVGFMDDATPVRVKKDMLVRLSRKPDRFWFRLDAVFKDANKSKCFSGPADNRSYCAYDLATAKKLTSWFAITKALNSKYPQWANQSDNMETKYHR